MNWHTLSRRWSGPGFVLMLTSLVLTSAVLALLLVGMARASAQTAEPGVERGPEPAQARRPGPLSLAGAAACSGVTAIPEEECQALVSLYQRTGGTDWLTNTHWLDLSGGLTPCDWYGVSCANGHVTQLSLAGNNLVGNVSKHICRLEMAGASGDLAYNGLWSSRSRARGCLDSMDPDWAATQTQRVQDLRITAFFTDALELAWTPIPYTGDGGGYGISVATSITGSYALHGQTSDKIASSYRVDGLEPGRTYYIRVRAFTPAHDGLAEVRGEPASIVAVTRSTGPDITLAVFFPGDNDLSAYVPSVRSRLRLGTAINPNLTVVMLSDRRGNHDTQVSVMAGGVITVTSAVTDAWGVDELDTSDPQVLAWFLTWARQNHPGDRELVSLMGHGVGLAPEVEWPASLTGAQGISPARASGNAIPPLPQELDFTPSDVNSRGYLSTIDLGQALDAATNNGADPFDLLFFDQCFQGNLDVLYQVRRSARIFIASPNYAWLTAAYGRYLSQLAPASTTEEMAQAIIRLYQNTLSQEHPNAIFWLRQTDIQAIAAAVSALGDALTQATQAGEDGGILAAARNSQFVDTTQCGRQRMELGPPDELLGAGSFAQNLRQAFPAGDAYGIHDRAGDLLGALANVQSTFQVGRPWIAPQELWQYDDTVTILAPLRRDAPGSLLWRASLYTTTMPMTATWSVMPTVTVSITTPFAFSQDGRWDDFLAQWYTATTPTLGAWCQYIPPARSANPETEAITLTLAGASPDGRAVRLQWEPSTDEEAAEQWLYVRRPWDIQWVLWETLPLTQTEYVHSGLTSGLFQYGVGVVDPDGTLLARSQPVSWTVPIRLFLPVVVR